MQRFSIGFNLNLVMLLQVRSRSTHGLSGREAAVRNALQEKGLLPSPRDTNNSVRSSVGRTSVPAEDRNMFQHISAPMNTCQEGRVTKDRPYVDNQRFQNSGHAAE